MSLIYPRSCEACETLLYKHEEMICNSCLMGLPKGNFHKNKNNVILQILGGRVPIVSATCLYVFEKGGKVQRLLHAVKYEGKQNLAIMMGELLGDELKEVEGFCNADLIIPIPLHVNKLKKRGFNQSEVFSKGLSKTLNIEVDANNLFRQTDTSTQTRKRKYERWENVKDVFELKNKTTLKNKHIVLVDDVITTGATIEAAWQALKEVEGIRVSLATIAFADK